MPPESDPDLQRAKKYKSVFELAPGYRDEDKPQFFPPESFGSVFQMDTHQVEMQIQNLSTWDIATRYHDLKSKRLTQKYAQHLRHLSVEAILQKAQEVLGSVVHPLESGTAPWPELPAQAEQVDFDLDETLENAPLLMAGALSELFTGESEENLKNYPLTENEIWMSYSKHRRQPIVLCVDTSLSMTGEKLALTAVALAVVLLEFPDDPIGMIAFENEARILKSPDEKISLELLIERFLDVPAQGYTHLEDGMKVALKLAKNAQSGRQGRPASTVLLTDGKYTAGRDPTYLAPRFPHLVLLKMGREKASLDFCKELARQGRGALREVNELGSLPSVMYGVVKDLLRGRSVG